MSSRKVLKKEVKKVFYILYNDLVSYMLFAEAEQRKTAQGIFAGIAPLEKEVISRINAKPSAIKENTKKYYDRLIAETNTKIREILDEISKLP